MELKGKPLAELRNKEIKEMLMDIEARRDHLYDEVANRKGQILVLEEVIKEIYDRIISVNKEVQQEELKEAVKIKAKEAEEAREQEERDKKETFAEAQRGIKTPKLERPKRAKKTKTKK